MRQILHSYKLRLTNLSQGNRSLKLGRLGKRRDIDLKDFDNIEEDSAEKILARIIEGKDVNLLSRLNPRFEAANVLDRRLNQVYRTAVTLEEESGSYDLFLGYPFVEGKFIDDTICRCPVLLFPVRLERNLQGRPRWKLSYLKGEGIQFNKTFFLAYERYNQLRLKDPFWDEEIENGKDWLLWIRGLYEKIKEYELEVNFNPRLFDLEIQSFKDMRKEELDHFRKGVLTFRSQAVLGIFPQSDSALLSNYNQIEEKLEDFPLEHLFQAPITGKTKDLPYIKEEDRFFVTDVDQSQEEAILKVKHGKSLVVHGPPGTGKSQVIVNIMADALAHGKKVLLVSQKRAALDVVYKRMAGLGLANFAVLLHDYRHDRADIFSQIRRQVDSIETYKKDLIDLNITKWEHDYKRLSREVDQLNRDFEALHKALLDQKPFGISVHELYLKADKEAAILPIKEFAEHSGREQLLSFCEKVQTLLDYQDLLDPAHPWAQRLSFRRYQSGDRDGILLRLQGLGGQINMVNGQYSKFSEAFGKDILDPEQNKNRILHFKEWDSRLKNIAARQDYEALDRQKIKPDSLKKRLQKLGTLLKQLDKCELLDDGYWTLLGELLKHDESYQNLHMSPFRRISLDYQRARWFFNKILKRFDQKISQEYYKKVIKKEVDRFRKLHQWFVKNHENGFLGDFPLLNTQNEKRDWLKRKMTHLQQFRELNDINYFLKLKPKFRVGNFDKEHWENSISSVREFDTYNSSLSNILANWRAIFHSDQVAQLKSGFKSPGGSDDYVDKLTTSFEKDFEDLRDLDALLANYSSLEMEALEQIRPAVKELNPEELTKAIKNSVYHYWIEKAEKNEPILREVSSRSWPRKERDFTDKFFRKREKLTELILRRLKESLVDIIEYNRLKNPITFREIYHQVSKKRRLWSVRKLIEKSWDTGLNLLLPCWMASPESAAAIFPMKKDFFDLVIFDEASQCFVEKAIPVLLRGKQAVVAGDDKQLAPTDLYRVRHEDMGEDEFVEDEIALEVNSILDLVKNTFEESNLSWHYRSQDQSLINFSNQAFYEGRLEVIEAAKSDPLNVPALNWISVDGKWRNNKNEEEAIEVISLIKRLIKRADKPSIGVVTFNFMQQELIKDYVDRELEYLGKHEPQTYELFRECLYKHHGEEFQGLFVKNIENVQGDERDIIIFSTGYGPNEKGKISTNFGLLNKAGGENRLNVAISRARKKIYVICSFNPAELKVENATNDGPRLFRDYLSYVKAISEGREKEAIQMLNIQYKEDLTYEAPNPLADRMEAHYGEKGYDTLRNVGKTCYKVDLAVRQPGQSHFNLAVECEGPNFFSGKTAKERHIYRKALLEGRGWTFRRVWGRNLWLGRFD
ncbi:MAG: AAA domain-containing protein [Bacteroidia bacterium]|nr:AAA domain-containing protein [Bacteroidia bacterium]